MPTEERKSNILLKDLREEWVSYLGDKVFEAFEDELSRGIVHEEELREEVYSYYTWTKAWLQEFYSTWSHEWEVFREAEGIRAVNFREFLIRRRMSFEKQYQIVDLNIAFWIDMLGNNPSAAPSYQSVFMDRWRELLSAKERSFQMRRMEELLSQFTLIKYKESLPSGSHMIGERASFLIRNHQTMEKTIMELEAKMRTNPYIRELVSLLGKRNGGESGRNSYSGSTISRVIAHASASDIVGYNEGRDLGHLIPEELCYWADEGLRDIFLKKYSESALRQFESRSESVSTSQKDKKYVSQTGPYIICLDTSTSMQGERERLAKSAVLAIAMLTEKTHRACQIINFSEDSVCLNITNLYKDIPMLLEFISKSFHGGTDITSAISLASRIVRDKDYRESDVVIISDFEIPALGKVAMDMVSAMKRKKTRFYGLVFGSHGTMWDDISIMDRYWEMGC